jgi:hypothetical protein
MAKCAQGHDGQTLFACLSGWNLPDELEEPDFDAIRDRADFKMLVAELEKKALPKK